MKLPALSPANCVAVYQFLMERKGVDCGELIESMFNTEAAQVGISQSFADWAGLQKAYANLGWPSKLENLDFPNVEIHEVEFLDTVDHSDSKLDGGLKFTAAASFILCERQVILADNARLFLPQFPTLTLTFQGVITVAEHPELFGLDGE